MLTGIRNAQSLILDGKHLQSRYEGPVFKGYYESPNSVKGVRKFYCIQSTCYPDQVLFLGDSILDQVFIFGLAADARTWATSEHVEPLCVLLDRETFQQWQNTGQPPIDVGSWCRASMTELYTQVICS